MISKHNAEDLERPLPEARGEGCSELSKVYAGPYEEGWRTL